MRLGLVIAALSAAAALITTAQTPPSESTREFKVTARKYDFSPGVIRVKRGDHVRLIVTATDREHGLKLDGFHVDQNLPKGKTVTVEFTVDQVGHFPFQCSHFCGIGHGKMKGELIVE